MRKLLILVLVSITAFLGVNLTKVSTYAATSDDVTYVVEGDRIYVEFGYLAQNDHSFLVDNTSVRSVYTDGLILFDIPYMAESMHVEYLDNGQFVDITADMYDFSDPSILQPKFKIWIDTLSSTTLAHVGDNNADLVEWSLTSFIGDYIRIYFQMPETITSSIHFDLIYNDSVDQGELSGVLDPADFTFLSNHYQSILSTTAIITNYQDETVTLSFDHAGFHNEMNFIQLSGTYSDGEFSINFYENGDLAFYGNAVPKDGSQHVEIVFDVPPFDNVDPIIDGDTIVVNIDNPLPEATLRAEISAWDDLDGDITADLVYEGGTYESARTAGTLVVGNTYTIVYSVEDSSGNITQATINVEVVDITKPNFEITNTTTEISYTQTLNLETFKANLLATDNYDAPEDLVINILTDNYTANKLVIGSYTVVYRVIDTSTNYRDITITVDVIDNVAPVVTGPNNFNVPVSPKTNISVMLQQFTAADAIDGDVTSSIEVLSDAYTAASTPGMYSVTIRFSDSSGNTTNKTFTITMVDGVPPILFITSGLLIGVNDLQNLTVEQIITLLEAQGTITGFTVLSNTYTGNENTVGTYQMVVAYTQNQVQYQHTLSILVTPSQLLQWTVSFITNGGSTLASVIINDFGQLLTQAPTKSGYRFVGWYKDAELTQPFSMVTGRITENTTLYAKWVPMNAGTPSVIIDNLSNLKLVDIVLIVGTITAGIFIGFVAANKKKPTPKRKRG